MNSELAAPHCVRYSPRTKSCPPWIRFCPSDEESLGLFSAPAVTIRDGAVAVHFSAKLTADQYAQLFQATRDAETKRELENMLLMIANEWDVPSVTEDA